MKQDKNITKKDIPEEVYNVWFLKGTEPPGSGKYLHNKEKGKYSCTICGHTLFSSDTKYDSQTGWPAFWDVMDQKSINKVKDMSLGMNRTEVLCSSCGAHLGHVFEDGPKDKTGLRYCINSLSLEFTPED